MNQKVPAQTERTLPKAINRQRPGQAAGFGRVEAARCCRWTVKAVCVIYLFVFLMFCYKCLKKIKQKTTMLDKTHSWQHQFGTDSPIFSVCDLQKRRNCWVASFGTQDACLNAAFGSKTDLH